MLARARGVPMVAGLGQLAAIGHAEAIVDGDERPRRAVARPQVAAGDDRCGTGRWLRRSGRRTAHRAAPAITADGVAVTVMINVADPAEVDAVDIGDLRRHRPDAHRVPVPHGRPLPDEDEQYRAYRRLLEWAAGKPVTIRTLDAGGDKPIAGLTPDGETNPFLGVRGLRLSLARPEVFRVQLRALARAAVARQSQGHVPMVTVPEEFDRCGSPVRGGARGSSGGKGSPARRPPLGIMVEVPLPALQPELFPRRSSSRSAPTISRSIVTAAARDNAAVVGA